ncbi:hypothetical protein GLOTRDRAFT_133344 [Gloeophyllum trabeum ATCC 11539]|uniref:Rho termination factor-like N-terminal domain-containing protein n=1 Tax=Gloeophyllum trabeum (strain ATCC 11539 / FP-39264 / Madison 617) TaxID=670483 RepID=S7PUH8_GLOTA|nr:uncharacterized protein GLOTRDRAFT_133344 [Gloeophyllum trabeum ATCC 11539]EPQ51018.1 hypothetical protein GLOTRDRAFT_133344 [Gloeophyllum trabeum ATCC 11539]
MAAASTTNELSKLTVAQLKALCKEKHISGYSKLTKPALIQKILAASDASDNSVAAVFSSVSLSTVESSVSEASHGPAARRTTKEGLDAPARRTETPKDFTQDSTPNASGPGHLGLPNVTTGRVGSDAMASVRNLAVAANELAEAPAIGETDGSPPSARVAPTPDVSTSLSKDLVDASSGRLRNSPTRWPSHVLHSEKVEYMRVPTTSSRQLDVSTPGSGPTRPSNKTTDGYALNLLAKRPGSTLVPSHQGKKAKIAVDFGSSHARAGTTSASRTHRASCVTASDLPPCPVSVAPSKTSAFVMGPPHQDDRSPEVSGPADRTVAKQAKRFKPLAICKPVKPHISAPSRKVNGPSSACDESLALTSLRPSHLDSAEFFVFPYKSFAVPECTRISLPPSLSQRKRVQRWAVILSGLSDAERRQCAQVSRMFRYAGASFRPCLADN